MSARIACARSRNKRDGVGLVHRRQVELDLAGDPQRLAARRDDPERGRGGEQLGDRPGGVGQQLLEVVEDDVRLLVAEAGRDRSRPCRPRRRGAAAMSGTTSAASRTGASGTKTVPPSASSARNRASSIENRVLPVPPGPTIVSSRGSRSSQSVAASKSSRSRPRNLRRRSGEVDGTGCPQRRELRASRAGTAAPGHRSPSAGGDRGRAAADPRRALPSWPRGSPGRRGRGRRRGRRGGRRSRRSPRRQRSACPCGAPSAR